MYTWNRNKKKNIFYTHTNSHNISLFQCFFVSFYKIHLICFGFAFWLHIAVCVFVFCFLFFLIWWWFMQPYRCLWRRNKTNQNSTHTNNNNNTKWKKNGLVIQWITVNSEHAASNRIKLNFKIVRLSNKSIGFQ